MTICIKDIGEFFSTNSRYLLGLCFNVSQTSSSELLTGVVLLATISSRRRWKRILLYPIFYQPDYFWKYMHEVYRNDQLRILRRIPTSFILTKSIVGLSSSRLRFSPPFRSWCRTQGWDRARGRPTRLRGNSGVDVRLLPTDDSDPDPSDTASETELSVRLCLVGLLSSHGAESEMSKKPLLAEAGRGMGDSGGVENCSLGLNGDLPPAWAGNDDKLLLDPLSEAMLFNPF